MQSSYLSLIKWMLIGAFLITANKISAQPKVTVTVYPGVELLSIIHSLTDSMELVKSAYQQDVFDYFGQYRNHPAVQRANALPFINCDFPLRHAWAFYDFPEVKLYDATEIGAYNKYFKQEEVIAYFKACMDFARDTEFWNFFQQNQSRYEAWIESFEENLYADSMLQKMQDFYRLTPSQEINFTLGTLNCNSFVLPNMVSINPHFKGGNPILVAYGNLIYKRDSLHIEPNYHNSWTNQLIWHEGGHIYINDLFNKYSAYIDSFAYIAQQDSSIRQKMEPLSWSLFLNENVTQAVTSLLRIHRIPGVDRNKEMNRIGQYYHFAPNMIEIIEKEYYKQDKHKNFEAFFPVLLQYLKEKYPRTKG